MPGKRFKAEEIVNKLRQADVELARGSTVAAASDAIEISTRRGGRSERDGAGTMAARRMTQFPKAGIRPKVRRNVGV